MPRSSKNHIYFELLGNGGLYSINYERYLSENLTIRVGATDWELHLNGGMLSINEHVTVFPMLVNWIHGETEHKTELGAGIDLFFVDKIFFTIGHVVVCVHCCAKEERA